MEFNLQGFDLELKARFTFKHDNYPDIEIEAHTLDSSEWRKAKIANNIIEKHEFNVATGYQTFSELSQSEIIAYGKLIISIRQGDSFTDDEKKIKSMFKENRKFQRVLLTFLRMELITLGNDSESDDEKEEKAPLDTSNSKVGTKPENQK